jgi:Protein of unknown function (DUF565)
VQNTRLNTFFDRTEQQFTQWRENPWRRLSLLLISLLFGNLLASIIATSTGQRANLDVVVSIAILSIVEAISWLTYGTAVGRRRQGANNAPIGQRPILVAILQSLKLGLLYGLFVEACKLGS